VLRVDRDAIDGTDLNTLGYIVMTHTLGAFIWVDLIDQFTQVNSIIWALRLTDIAVDAFISNHQGHVSITFF
jgi:hypothetical protein